MGETRVDLLHLLEDLRDAYPGSTEETILTEIVANALDSGAAMIAITTDSTAPGLTIVDDGAGMRRRELARYHDIASSSKVRGAGIGFAGVGIKIALLVCAAVVTETRRGKHHVASFWRLASRQKAPWRWVPPPGLVPGEHGTAVHLTPTNALSPLLDPGFVEATLRDTFQPLLDPALADTLGVHYRRGVLFVLNGRPLARRGWAADDRVAVEIRVGRKRKPVGAGYLVRVAMPLPEDVRGVAVSTFGKVIKRGWDWLALAPATPDLVGGIVEVPALAECLTLNKADFVRAGARGATYLAHRKAIQEAVSRQLTVWGGAAGPAERAQRRAARPMERDLETVLADLAADFPLVAALVEQRAGGQRRLPVAGASPVAAEPPAFSVMPYGGPARADDAGAAGEADAIASARPPATEVDDDAEEASPPARTAGHLPAGARARRPGRYGLSIQFERRPEDHDLSRLVESTVWVNDAHPAYRRAVASRSEGYHVAVAVAMALAPLAVDPAKEHGFVTAFLESWGRALDRRKRGRGR